MKTIYSLLFTVAYSASTKAATTEVADLPGNDHSVDLNNDIPTIHYIKTFQFDVIPLPYRDPHANDPKGLSNDPKSSSIDHRRLAEKK